MKLIYSNFSRNKTLPILLNNTTSLPEYLPFLYTIVNLRGQSLNTKIKHLLAIKILYSYILVKLTLAQTMFMNTPNTLILDTGIATN